jgi:hypothetical protein
MNELRKRSCLAVTATSAETERSPHIVARRYLSIARPKRPIVGKRRKLNHGQSGKRFFEMRFCVVELR